MSTLTNRHPNLLRRAGMLALAASAVLMLGVLPAVAGHGADEYDDVPRWHGHTHDHNHGYGYGHRKHDHDGRHFVVPTAIPVAVVADYAPYYGGSVYFAPHRHTHVVYYFPVFAERGGVYEPHSYCRGMLFRSQVSYVGSRLSFSLGF